jgi:hypothetical protein
MRNRGFAVCVGVVVVVFQGPNSHALHICTWLQTG